MNDFLKLKSEDESNIKIFDNVDIIVDPELEDESTVDINNYLNKVILQCRICGNMFPSDEILDNETECPICGEISNDGFIFKGKLKNSDEKKISSEEKQAINDLAYEDDKTIPIDTIDTKLNIDEI